MKRGSRRASRLVRYGGIFLGVLAVFILIGGIWLKSRVDRYLAGPEFLELLSQETSKALRVDGAFRPLRWSGPEIYSESFEGTGQAKGVLESLETSGLRARMIWNSIWQGVWEIDRIEIQRADLVFRSEQGKEPEEIPASKAARASGVEAIPILLRGLLSWLPRTVRIGEVTVASGRVVWGDSILEGSRLVLRPEGGAWIVESRGGTLSHPGFPANRVGIIRVRLMPGRLYLTEAGVQFDEGGSFKASGEADFAEKTSRFQVEVEGVPVKNIAPKALSEHLTGTSVISALVVHDAGERTISGSFRVEEGLLRGLEAQDVLARFTRSPQFKRLPLQELSANFTRSANGTTLRDFVLESRGLIRIEGTLEVEPEQEGEPEVQGEFKVGLTSQSLQWLPGSQERVFRTSGGGYLWTDVRITGTVSNPKEDLSRRLAVAMGEQVLLAPVSVLQHGGVQAVESGVDLLEGGGEILKTGADTAVEGIQGTLDLLSPLLPGSRR